MSNEYIIHGTQYKNLIHILIDGFIDNEPIKKYRTMLIDKSPKLIFTQLIYPDIPNEIEQNPHWGQCCIVLKKELLKDYPFFVTPVGGFDAEEKQIILQSDGNLSKMPRLTTLKNYIKKYLVNKYQFMKSITFMHSHEILFDKRIPLDKYGMMILINETYLYDKEKDKFNKLVNKTTVPIKYYKIIKKHKPYGINNFIDTIQS